MQLCGDAHLANFGGFASPGRQLVFDVNDFDETLPGPFEWDVKRLAASLAVAGRDNGFTARECRIGVLAAVQSYRTAMRGFAGMPMLDVWYARLDIEEAFRGLRSQLAKRGRTLTEKTWRRRAPETAWRRWASSPRWWTGNAGSSAPHP